MIWTLGAVAVATALLTVLFIHQYLRWKQRHTGLQVFYVAMQDDLPTLYALLEGIYRGSNPPPVLDCNPRPGRFEIVPLETREALRNQSRALYRRSRPYFPLLPAGAIAAILEVRRLFGSIDTKKEKVYIPHVLDAKLRLMVLGEAIGLVEKAVGDQYQLLPKR